MFRFTVRDVLWLTVIVALAVGWGVDRRRLATPLAKLAEYERAEQIAIKRKQDEKRLRDLEWKLIQLKAAKNGAPMPAGYEPQFSAQEFDEMHELAERLSRQNSD